MSEAEDALPPDQLWSTRVRCPDDDRELCMEIGSSASRSLLKREKVRGAILELIEDRRPGDAIPSERTLCARLGVSRPTLRAAVDQLVVAGLLVREHGRGMFVAGEKITQELSASRDAFALPQAAGAWTSRLLAFRTVQAGAGWAAGCGSRRLRDPVRRTRPPGRRFSHRHRVPARPRGSGAGPHGGRTGEGRPVRTPQGTSRSSGQRGATVDRAHGRDQERGGASRCPGTLSGPALRAPHLGRA